MRRRFLTLFLAFGACLLPAADSNRFKEDFHYSHALAPGGRLSVENFNGTVEVSGWDQNLVDISGTKYAETAELLRVLRIETTGAGNVVRIRAIKPEGTRGNMGATMVIKVPRRTDLDTVASSNGALRVADVEANCRLATSNGAVRVERVRGNLEAATSNGKIEIREVSGSVSARTSNGAISAYVRDTDSGRPLTLETSNGSVDLQMESSRQNDVRASTSNGSITVRMPSYAGARVRAVTSSHSVIESDFDVRMQGTISKSRLEGEIGSGGALLDLTTSNGNIRLAKM